MMNKKINGTALISAYACCPGRGSEPGYGWNYLMQYAKNFKKVILVTSSQDHQAVTDKLRESGISNVTMKVAKLRFGLDRLHYSPIGGIHMHYLLWLRQAVRVIDSIKEEIDFAQHVTFGSLQFGSPLYKLKCPFIFGPVGGGQRTNTIFYPLMSRKARLLETIRNGVSYLFCRFSPFFKGTMRNASLIYCTNKETLAEARRFLPTAEHHRIRMMLDMILEDRFLADPVVRRKRGTKFTALWVGRLLPRKGVEILLNTARLLKDEDFELVMVGDGPLKEKTLAFIKENHLEDTIRFKGWVDPHNIRQYYHAADVLLFFSYRDSTGVQIMEAFSQGVPVVSFDQFGASLIINEDLGVKVPLGGDLDDLQKRTADMVRDLIHDRDRVRVMGENAVVYAGRFTWEHRMEMLLKDIKPLLTDTKTLVYENADLRLERV